MLWDQVLFAILNLILAQNSPKGSSMTIASILNALLFAVLGIVVFAVGLLVRGAGFARQSVGSRRWLTRT